MCGIVACRSSEPALSFLLPALRRLEYRGYDSAGVSVQTAQDRALVRLRSVGRMSGLTDTVDAYGGPDLNGVGIGHTRWATHGRVTVDNAHPHEDCLSDVHVVHNGIIENADTLRSELELRGHRFRTEVDSEVVAHLVEEALDAGSLAGAVEKAVSRLVGSWALAVVRRDDPTVVLTAHRSPLLVAVGPDGTYAASDVTALAGSAEQVQVVENGDLVTLAESGLLWRRADGSTTPPDLLPISVTSTEVDRQGHADFMAKEIAEQAAVSARILGRLVGGVADGGLWRDLGLPAPTRVRFAACGTSLNAARVLGRVLARYGVPSTAVPASELDGLVDEPGTLVVALSQSGETADVLRALEDGRGSHPVLALTNSPTSTLARLAEGVVDLGVGPEIGVAASKTFSAQVVAGTAVLLSGLVAAGRVGPEEAQAHLEELCHVPGELRRAHEVATQLCPGLAAQFADAPGFLFVARGAAQPYVEEGALKLKELTYRWTECQPAGELKHGPIALIEDGTPVVVVDDGHPKLAGNIAELRARGAAVITIGGPGSTVPYRAGGPSDAPWGPLASVVVLQHLARELALVLGRDVEKPRNLAKSVTVE